MGQTSGVKITRTTGDRLVAMADRTGLSATFIGEVAVAFLHGGMKRSLPPLEIRLGMRDDLKRGPAFTCETTTLSLNERAAGELADWSRVLRLSRSWLFEHAVSELLGRLDERTQLMCPATQWAGDTMALTSWRPEIETQVQWCLTHPRQPQPARLEA